MVRWSADGAGECDGGGGSGRRGGGGLAWSAVDFTAAFGEVARERSGSERALMAGFDEVARNIFHLF